MTSKILIVEDERIVAIDIEQRLRMLGYSVVGSVATGQEALRLCSELHPDLVIMDIRIQGDMDGIATAACIRRDHFIPIVYLTAHSDEQTLERARKTEPYGYLLKPFQERELRTVIEMALYKHQAEKQLRASERRYATTLSSIGEGVIATSRSGTITFLNPMAERLTGWIASQASGKPLAEVFRLREEGTGLAITNPLAWGLNSAKSTERVSVLLAQQHSPDLPIELSVSPILDDQGQEDGAVLVFHDVSERRRQEEEKAQLNERLREASKLDAIGLLAGGVAHDFNNLLTVIIGHIETLLLDKDTTHRDWESLNAILQSSERAARLTKQLLAFGRRSMLQRQFLDLNAIIHDVASMLRRLIGEHIQLVLHLEPHLAAISADRGQLEQVVVNLAVNARNAMPDGGTLTLTTNTIHVTADTLAESVDVPSGRYVRLSVIDTGTGMTPEVRERIFEPFFTTRKLNQGTGLGLSVVHGIVKQTGGYIHVHSQQGVGTQFVLYFPVASGSPPKLATEVTPEPATGHETILLVEDEELVRTIARLGLERRGYRVLEAVSAQHAFQVVAEHNAPIDLLITDLVMPGMPGWQLAEQLQATRPGLKVLFISGYADVAVENDARARFRGELLTKPFTAQALASKIRALLDSTGQPSS